MNIKIGTINFMGIRNIAFAVTLILTVIALGSWFTKGINFGLDFTGGTLIELTYEQPAISARCVVNWSAPATRTLWCRASATPATCWCGCPARTRNWARRSLPPCSRPIPATRRT